MSDRDNEERREKKRGDNTWLWILVIAALAFVVFSGNGGEVNAGPIVDTSSVNDRSINVMVEPAQVTVPVHVDASAGAAAEAQIIACDLDIPASNGEPHVVLLGAGRMVNGTCVRQ